MATPSDSSPVSIRITRDEVSILEALQSENRSQTFKDALALLGGTELAREVALYPRSIDEPEIDEAIEEAVAAACDALQGLFPRGPGVELRGINSNFQGTLGDHIRAMLCGLDGAKLTHRREMSALLANGRTFGRLKGDNGRNREIGYTVMQFGRGTPDLFLSSETGRMVEASRYSYADTFTSQDYAHDGALRALSKASQSPRQERLHMVSLRMSTGDGDTVTVVEIADIPGESGMTEAEYAVRCKTAACRVKA